ncbi:hypothetical protein ATCC90586_010189 [Pythium insidiosum]|nr:hypothetical protein ATCC90586_010189 [Pythium insidiosum]
MPGDFHLEERDDEEDEGEDGVVEEQSFDGDSGRASDLELEEKGAAILPPTDVSDDQSDKSSVLAEDDGTLFGKTFGPDGEDLQEDVVTPMLNTEAMLKNQKIEYVFRVVDVESGVVWFTKKRFKELYKLHRKKERQFRLRVAVLRGQPQSYFGIPVNKISVSSWRSVIELIKEIDDAFLPQDKMRKLVATAHQIHSLHRNERRMCRQEQQQQQQQSEFAGSSPASGSDEDDVLSGDDFLPIFIYVIVHANLSAPIMTQVLLNRLCDPEQRRSESGYYLATYEAALHHILSEASFPDA